MSEILTNLLDKNPSVKQILVEGGYCTDDDCDAADIIDAQGALPNVASLWEKINELNTLFQRRSVF